MSIDVNSRPALDDDHLRGLLRDVTAKLSAKRAAAIAGVPDWEALREQARAIKRATLADLDRHLLDFERHLVERGGVVHWAADAAEACHIVESIAAENGVRRAVKSKSMISEEIGLNAFLDNVGVRVVETDFGEYIIQVAGERPSHIIAPAIHKSRADVGRLFAGKLGVPYTDDPHVLASHARSLLRDEFVSAQMGISGVNFGVAATGTLVIVENEGNARLCTTMPPVHVALMGIEKLVPAIDDLTVFLALLPRNATGQAMTSYVSFITGPRRRGDRSGPEQLHVVIIDNGRSRMLADPNLRDVLTCIRCGACQNACPIYRQIGGHSYGGVYAGPIGSLLGPGLEPRTSPPDLPFVSTLCGACAEACPVKIDIPRILLHLRQVAMVRRTDHPVPHRRAFRWGMRAWAAAMAGPRRYAAASHAVRMIWRVLGRGHAVHRLPAPLDGWTQVRDFPMPARRTFRQFIRESERVRTSEPRERSGAKGPPRASEQGRPAGRSVPSPDAFSPRPASRDPRALIRQFVTAAESVQASVSVVPDDAEARSRVAAIIAEHGADQVGVTDARYGVAESGTIVVCSGPGPGRVESLRPPVHVALVRASDLLSSLPDLLAALSRDCSFERSSAVTLITGPSRTADIELTLTIGVHGPKQLFIVLIDRPPALPGPRSA